MVINTFLVRNYNSNDQWLLVWFNNIQSDSIIIFHKLLWKTMHYKTRLTILLISISSLLHKEVFKQFENLLPIKKNLWPSFSDSNLELATERARNQCSLPTPMERALRSRQHWQMRAQRSSWFYVRWSLKQCIFVLYPVLLKSSLFCCYKKYT